MRGKIEVTPKEHFESKFYVTPKCWIWNAGKDKDGYGQFYDGNKNYRAHRYSWALYYGSIPCGKFICHKCDNPSCVNPDHLFLGSNQENTLDRHKKGRSARGEYCGMSKITDNIAIRIRESKGNIREIAKEFGISKTTVRDIKRMRTWKHI